MDYQIARQYSVFLENRAGALAELCRLISDRSINLYAICAIDTVEEAVLRVIPENAPEALDALKSGGFRVIETDVFLVTIENMPGATGKVASLLAEKGINIDYIYSSAHPDNQNTYLVLKVQQIDETRQLLEGYNR